MFRCRPCSQILLCPHSWQPHFAAQCLHACRSNSVHRRATNALPAVSLPTMHADTTAPALLAVVSLPTVHADTAAPALLAVVSQPTRGGNRASKPSFPLTRRGDGAIAPLSVTSCMTVRSKRRFTRKSAKYTECTFLQDILVGVFQFCFQK